MNVVRKVWRELVRPRGHATHRFYRVGRSSRSGVALLMVMTTLLLMTILSADIQFGAAVRLRMSSHQRDEVKAEALAQSGMQMYQLILVASKMLGKNPMIQQYASAFGINGDSLWQMVPFINTGMMRMLLVSGGNPDDLQGEGGAPVDVTSVTGAGNLTEEQRAESRDGGSKREANFLDFDGDFFVEVTDEDSRINITRLKATTLAELDEDPTAQRLMSLMSGRENCAAVRASITLDGQLSSAPLDASTENDNDQFFYDRDLERRELIGNLADWVDTDDRRIWQGGQEDALYESLDDPYRSKNAPFDSMEEVRLVAGWQDDDVWERFADRLTVYGGGKVNVNSAECEVVWALLKTYLVPNDDFTVGNAMRAIETHKVMGGTFGSAAAFTQVLTNPANPFRVEVSPQLQQAITTESQVFRIHSVGEVGDARVTLDAVIDFSRSQTGKIVYWRMQ